MTFINATCRRPTGDLDANRQPVRCDFTTSQPSLFETHMDTVHGVKPGTTSVDVGSPWSDKETYRRFKWRPALPLPSRRPPSARKLFEPKPGEPGSTVSWRQLVPTGNTREELRYDPDTGEDRFVQVPQREWVDRTGQVFCLGPHPRSIWVVPYDPAPGERAVLVRSNRGNRLLADTVWDAETARVWMRNNLQLTGTQPAPEA